MGYFDQNAEDINGTGTNTATNYTIRTNTGIPSGSFQLKDGDGRIIKSVELNAKGKGVYRRPINAENVGQMKLQATYTGDHEFGGRVNDSFVSHIADANGNGATSSMIGTVNKIVAGPGIYISPSDGYGTVMISTQPISDPQIARILDLTWTVTEYSTSTNTPRLKYGDESMFVAVGQQGINIYSDDAETWADMGPVNQATISGGAVQIINITSLQSDRFADDGTLYYAVERGQYYSSGVPTGNYYVSTLWGRLGYKDDNNVFVSDSVFNAGNRITYNGADIEDFVNAHEFFYTSDFSTQGLTFDDALSIICCRNRIYSVPGIACNEDTFSTTVPASLEWSTSTNDSYYGVAIDQSYQYAVSIDFNNGRVIRSVRVGNNPQGWSQVYKTSGSSVNLSDIAFTDDPAAYPNPQWMVVGRNDTILTNNLAQASSGAWVQRTTGIKDKVGNKAQWTSVTCGLGRWVAVGGSGIAAYSDDGVTWTRITTGTTETLWRVRYSPALNVFVAVGENRTIVTIGGYAVEKKLIETVTTSTNTVTNEIITTITTETTSTVVGSEAVLASSNGILPEDTPFSRPSPHYLFANSSSTVYSEQIILRCINTAEYPKDVPVTFSTRRDNSGTITTEILGDAYFDGITATFITSELGTGTNTISASWPGESRYEGFTATMSTLISVTPAFPYSGTLALVSLDNPVYQLNTIPLLVEFSQPGVYTGKLQLRENIGTSTYILKTFDIPNTSTFEIEFDPNAFAANSGPYYISARWMGGRKNGVTYTGVLSNVVTQNVDLAALTLSASTSLNLISGTNTFIAVADGTITTANDTSETSVTFYDGSIEIASTSSINNSATIVVSSGTLAYGVHNIKAIWDNTRPLVTSNIVPVVIAPPATATMTLAFNSSTYVYYNLNATTSTAAVTATIILSDSYAGHAATGQVRVYDITNTSTLLTSTILTQVSGTSISANVSWVPSVKGQGIGNRIISAVYDGDIWNNATSATETLSIIKPTVPLTLSSDPNGNNYYNGLTFQLKVTKSSTSVIRNNAIFKNISTNQVLGSVPFSGNTATYTTSTVYPTNYTYVAYVEEDQYITTSTTNTLAVKIDRETPKLILTARAAQPQRYPDVYAFAGEPFNFVVTATNTTGRPLTGTMSIVGASDYTNYLNQNYTLTLASNTISGFTSTISFTPELSSVPYNRNVFVKYTGDANFNGGTGGYLGTFWNLYGNQSLLFLYVLVRQMTWTSKEYLKGGIWYTTWPYVTGDIIQGVRATRSASTSSYIAGTPASLGHNGGILSTATFTNNVVTVTSSSFATVPLVNDTIELFNLDGSPYYWSSGGSTYTGGQIIDSQTIAPSTYGGTFIPDQNEYIKWAGLTQNLILRSKYYDMVIDPNGFRFNAFNGRYYPIFNTVSKTPIIATGRFAPLTSADKLFTFAYSDLHHTTGII